MKSNKRKKEAGSMHTKESMHIDNQDYDEIIDKEELTKRKGITGDKTYYFIAYLRSFYTNDIHSTEAYNLTTLAKDIADKKVFYITKHNGYKLMKFSSILSGLHSLSKQVKNDLAREKEEKEKVKCKYKHKK